MNRRNWLDDEASGGVVSPRLCPGSSRLRKEANRPEELEALRRGWKLGGEDFLDWMLEKVGVRQAEAHPGRERDENGQTKAARIF